MSLSLSVSNCVFVWWNCSLCVLCLSLVGLIKISLCPVVFVVGKIDQFASVSMCVCVW